MGVRELRMVKTDMEIEVIRYAAKVSSEAHIVVMQSIRPGKDKAFDRATSHP